MDRTCGMRRIGLFTIFSKQIMQYLQARLPEGQYKLCEINFDMITTSKEAQDELVARFDSMEIIIADYKGFVHFPLLSKLKKVKWIQFVWSGVEKLNFDDESKPLFPITRFGGFGQHIAEFTISNIIAFERDFFKFYDYQKLSYWEPYGTTGYRMLSEMTITILGCGEIGKVIAKHCKQFDATVYGMVSKMRTNEESCVDKHFTSSELAFYLEKSDYICNVLPSTKQTKNLLTSNILRHCNGAVLINIGRGDVIDENTLIEALEKKWLRGAVLDVFVNEPLPTKSKLWSMENVHITPHVSGWNQPRFVAECFLGQLKLYEENKPLKYTVDWERRY